MRCARKPSYLKISKFFLIVFLFFTFRSFRLTGEERFKKVRHDDMLFLSLSANVITYFDICNIPSCIFNSPSSNKYWITRLISSLSASMAFAIPAGANFSGQAVPGFVFSFL